ncbi:23S rRNA (guanosine(2251)-2'-O)-methyltransferase RlmB [Thermosyntropha sp.]|uniref:23S rRNA (guanosine(2251)-2'-O)-methyltransferase RlmB n=1 Tax=Thermosyntropha sp. TaxID=2740820 RepID=UPI0025E2764A|nr:23S rRNA (guanosine(2251)-2'-O)-methyltransferase RlmB [Thermosyntropha sp.]MBO8158019.1 23S rRNA (guanosine(2251)-2'-O)-methyltransferase RlmB [Thermosyntropha sp.]
MKEKIAGINTVMEAIKGGRRKVYKVFIQEGRGGRKIEDLVKLAQARGIFIQYVEKQKLDKMSPSKNHQGIIAQIEDYPYNSVEEILEYAVIKGEEPFLVLLDGIEDPQNMGAIVRTAECAGVHGVVIPRHNSVKITEAVVRASAGAVEHMRIAKETNLVNVIKFLKKQGFWIVGADANGDRNYFDLDYPVPLALVIGSEGEGMRRLVKENCDILVKIPMKGNINSLNASVAAGLIMYEVVRQRNMVER